MEGPGVDLESRAYAALPRDIAPGAVHAAAALGGIELVPASVQDERRASLHDVGMLDQQPCQLGLLVDDFGKHPGSVALPPAERVPVHAVHHVRVTRQHVRVHRLGHDHFREPPGHVIQLLVGFLADRGECYRSPGTLRSRLPRALARIQPAADIALLRDEVRELEGGGNKDDGGRDAPGVRQLRQLDQRAHHDESPKALPEQHEAGLGGPGYPALRFHDLDPLLPAKLDIVKDQVFEALEIAPDAVRLTIALRIRRQSRATERSELDGQCVEPAAMVGLTMVDEYH
mmetsp:Transcript_67703/g.196073  ORF Transcript_67703/g.196073 Transcript_67703/m.196073 type:complete len:287 (+) Transcript_67703:392-1252(+)